MKGFMCDDFLLSNDTAKRLYHDVAKNLPIFDYHCHLNPRDIAEDRRFENMTQIWLEGDHYKWRGMRAAGISEVLITGNSRDYEKYMAWAKTVPQCLGNPLYHWTHLELRSPFGITDTLFGPDTADELWLKCNEMLSTPEFSARGIMRQMKVEMVGTTDDPIDTLEHHMAIKNDSSISTQVRPSWRPDKVFKIEQTGFVDYIQSLGAATDINIERVEDLQRALSVRLEYFHFNGCVSADHGLEVIRYAHIPSERTLDRIFIQRLQGKELDETEVAQFSTAIQVWLAKQYHKMGWVLQLHIGAMRNNSQRMLQLVGVDAGFDSIGDRPFAYELSSLLDEVDKTDQLPKTILYCLNPRDNEMLATMIGNFQGGGIAGKIQFGSGWWFNDQKDGMQRQIKQLSQLGLLSQFVGMLTDSRSFLSYTRHEYFRRILCDMVGVWIESGEMPNDDSLILPLITNICYGNASNYFVAKELQ